MSVSDIPYAAEGRQMVGRLSFDDRLSGRRPAVLVAHEGPGLDEHARSAADRLAALGYVAFALDYNGNGMPLPMDQTLSRLAELSADPQAMGRLALAGLDVLLDQPQADADRVAVIGYCFGGMIALELARTGADVRAVVGFHPGYLPARTDASRNIKGSVLMCSGTEDPFATPQQRMDFETEMREADVADWRIELYGGVGHSFTNHAVDEMGTPGLAYDARAERRSWQSMLSLFDEHFQPGTGLTISGSAPH